MPFPCFRSEIILLLWKPSCLFFIGVNHRAFVTLGYIPGSMEYQFSSFHKHFEIDLIHRVACFVIVGVNTVEVENYGDSVLGKVVMVGTVEMRSGSSGSLYL